MCTERGSGGRPEVSLQWESPSGRVRCDRDGGTKTRIASKTNNRQWGWAVADLIP